MGKSSSKNTKPNSEIGKIIQCPYCLQVMNEHVTYQDMDKHMKDCKILQNKKCLEIKRENDNRLNTPILIPYEIMDKILKEHNYPYTSNYQNNNDFDSNIRNFKNKINKLKKDWRIGSESIEISRENLIKDSMSKLNTVDIYKELKINFKGETNYDAGGIIREWLTILSKELSKEHYSKFINNIK